MKNFVAVKFVLLIILLSCFSISGQTIEEIEKELVGYAKNIAKFSHYGEGSDDQKLDQANRIFKEKLLNYTAKNPETLKHKFTELKKHLLISTSEDGKFRIYSWDTEGGGTMHFFENVYQYLGVDANVYSKSPGLEEGDPGGFFSDVFSLETEGETVYLTRFSSILSTSLAYQSVKLFKIEGNSLNEDFRLFKTKTGLKNSIGFEYDFFSVVDRPERPIKIILYDKSQKAVKIPVVIEDEKTPQGRVTNRFITYKFTGKYFKKVRR